MSASTTDISLIMPLTSTHKKEQNGLFENKLAILTKPMMTKNIV